MTIGFTLTDGSKVMKEEVFTGVNRNTDRTVTYEIDGYMVTVIIAVSVIGNNSMNITSVTAIIEKAVPIPPLVQCRIDA